MSDGKLVGRIFGTGKIADTVDCETEHIEDTEAEVQMIEVTFDFYMVEFSVTYSIKEAEEFLVGFRDEIIRAKRAQLEWETDTDPETGIADDEDSRGWDSRQ